MDYVLAPLPCNRSGAADRFWPRVDVRGPDDCWPWTGPATSRGRGSVMVNGFGSSPVAPARVAYELAGKGDPAGLEVHHTCEEGLCCNPAHLVAVTPDEHRRIHAPRVACSRCGAPRFRAPRGTLTCRPCDAARKRTARGA